MCLSCLVATDRCLNAFNGTFKIFKNYTKYELLEWDSATDGCMKIPQAKVKY